MNRSLVFLSVCLFALLSAGGSALAATPPPALSLAGEGELTVTAAQGEDGGTAELFVVNPGEAVPLTVEFIPSEETAAKLTKFEPGDVGAEAVTRIELTFSGVGELDAASSGVLVVKGGEAPLVRELKLSPGLQPSRDWPLALAIGALAAIVGLFVAMAIFAASTGKWSYLGKAAPGPKWSFSSWATTLTAVGALLGTVVAAATYPEEPKQIDKDTLVALGVLFGALVVIGPFIFQALRNPRASAADQEAGLWGYNWTLLLSCAITCGAVLGELGCLGLLAGELIEPGFWADAASAVVIVLAFLAAYYFLVTAWSLVNTDWAELVAKAKAQAEKEKKQAAAAGLFLGVAGARGLEGEIELEEFEAERAEAPEAEAPEAEAIPVAPAAASWSLP